VTDHELLLKAVVLAWPHRTRTTVNHSDALHLVIELGRREFWLPLVAGLPTIPAADREALLVELAGREER
jgi:hypothetical protein